MLERLLTSYPLFVKDPYFSIWSPSEYLNKSNTIFWHGENKPMYGTVLLENGEHYSFLGKSENKKTKTLEQKSIKLKAFSTIYEFTCDCFEMEVEFLSPLPPNNLEILSCPVCYVNYNIIPKTNLGKVVVSVSLSKEFCYHDGGNERIDKDVRGGIIRCEGFETAYFGLRRQYPMSHTADRVSADWGYYYIAGEDCFVESELDLWNTEADGITLEKKADLNKYITAKNTHKLDLKQIVGTFMVAYDDMCSIFYYGDWLKGYFFKDGKNIIDALNYSMENLEKIIKICDEFDNELKQMAKRYDDNYLLILYAALRQSIGAHKLVEDKKGRLLFLSKECDSDGCIATVDISYPSMPLYLLFNSRLLKGMLYPIIDFAKMPVWTYDFAPHDAGVYPYCNGQYYGIENGNTKYNNDIDYKDYGNTQEEVLPMYYLYQKNNNLYSPLRHMPVEECGNMMIITAACFLVDDDMDFLQNNFSLFETWAQYLLKYGLEPSNQLCTDDFAGHCDKNANLSIKACVGIEAFSIICKALNKNSLSAQMHEKAKEYANIWQQRLCKADHSPLTFDSGEETFSLKYNIAFDKLFGSGLFDDINSEKEIKYYVSKMNRYGTPLDNRASYTKSDWLLWVSVLTKDIDVQNKIIGTVANFLKESEKRVPFPDWYDTISAKSTAFINRTVQGGLFILLLKDSGILKKKRSEILK